MAACYRLQAASYEPQATRLRGYTATRLQAASCKLQATRYKLHATRHKLQVARRVDVLPQHERGGEAERGVPAAARMVQGWGPEPTLAPLVEARSATHATKTTVASAFEVWSGMMWIRRRKE